MSKIDSVAHTHELDTAARKVVDRWLWFLATVERLERERDTLREAARALLENRAPETDSHEMRTLREALGVGEDSAK